MDNYHNPYTITFGIKDVFVDLGAERVLAAEKGHEKIAVEIKTFLSASDMRDLEAALGQYVLYRSLLARIEPERKLFLAVPFSAFLTTFDEPIARPALEDLAINLIAFDPARGDNYQMADLAYYREVIRKIILNHAQYPPSHGDIAVETIFDEAKDHYELVYAGWSGAYRIHGSAIHIDIRDGKIYIQHDGTEEGIADQLVAAGIPHDRIVLAFKHPDVRPDTEFAVA